MATRAVLERVPAALYARTRDRLREARDAGADDAGGAHGRRRRDRPAALRDLRRRRRDAAAAAAPAPTSPRPSAPIRPTPSRSPPAPPRWARPAPPWPRWRAGAALRPRPRRSLRAARRLLWPTTGTACAATPASRACSRAEPASLRRRPRRSRTRRCRGIEHAGVERGVVAGSQCDSTSPAAAPCLNWALVRKRMPGAVKRCMTCPASVFRARQRQQPVPVGEVAMQDADEDRPRHLRVDLVVEAGVALQPERGGQRGDRLGSRWSSSAAITFARRPLLTGLRRRRPSAASHPYITGRIPGRRTPFRRGGVAGRVDLERPPAAS